ncbi:MAG: LCP family protein [Eubacterium sp.]|nr:LCP family protein [Eubacterium sp.]
MSEPTNNENEIVENSDSNLEPQDSSAADDSIIDIDSDENLEFIEGSEDPGFITDTGDGTGFVADWDAIEKNYQEANFGHSHSHHHRHSSSRHHSSGEHKHHSSHSSHKSSKHHGSKKKDSKKKDKKDKKKWSKKKKIILGIVLFFFAIIVGSISALFIMRWMGQRELTNHENLNLMLPEWVDYRDGGWIIYYKGHEYTFNDNIATFLFMGIDNRKLKTKAKMGTAGQADALYLMTYDITTKKMRVLCINRDTMTDISRYDEAGNYIDTKKTQICLAYAFGDGKKTSAENEKTAVQRFIYNIPVNAYYAIDLSAIKILNDDVGGVPVKPEYTFKEFKKGVPVTLHGDQAETFVRHRDIRLMDDNLRRIECQKQYIRQFASRIVPATRSNLNTPSKLYNHSKKYTVSSLNAPMVVYLATDLAFSFNGFEMINTKGEYKKVPEDPSAEYFVKEVPFFETILDIFYTQTR